MTQHSSGSSQPDSDVAHIEELIRDLEGTPNSLIREHLEAARSSLLGSMPSEYQFDLNLAEGLLSDIEDKGLQARIRDFLRSQRHTPL